MIRGTGLLTYPVAYRHALVKHCFVVRISPWSRCPDATLDSRLADVIEMDNDLPLDY